MSGHSKWATIKHKKGALDAKRGKVFTRLIKEISIAAKNGGDPGYGPGGVAILLDINTDNRNRTVSEIRHAFGKNGGNMAAAGAVAYLFHKKGDIVIPKTAAKEDDLMSIVLEAGADDLRDDGENWEVLTEPSVFEAVVEAVKKAGIQPTTAEVAMIPQNYIKLEGSQATQMIRLVEAFEEHDDVQNVHSNFDIDQKLLEEVAAG
jgi:YebC/PmpR family DNA-binding regulatory protein